MKLEVLIREYREREHLTMQEFADRCGLSKGYVSMLENGKHPQSQRRLVPSLETLKKVSVGMGISMDELLRMLDGETVVSLVRDPPDPEMDEQHALLLKLFDQLPPESRAFVLAQLRGVVQSQKEPDPR